MTHARTLGITFFALALLWSASVAAQECPKGYKCIPDEQADQIADKLDLHNCMVEAANNDEIQLTLDPNRVIVTKDGQVFAKDTTKARLQWCEWDLEMTAKNEIDVQLKKEDPEFTWGFRLRVKLGIAWLPTYLTTGDLKETFDPVLLLEPFHVGMGHIQVHGGLKSFGLSLGLDLTKNADVFGGVGLGYKNADIVPTIGFSLSFN